MSGGGKGIERCSMGVAVWTPVRRPNLSKSILSPMLKPDTGAAVA
jgi:hypothetical protein